MDDNGALLYHARNGATLEELGDAGIVPTRSQLALLQLYRVLKRDGDRLITSFPVIGPEILTDLRRGTRALADGMVQRLESDIRQIRHQLCWQGHDRHHYAVIFGHAVDGVLWDELRGAGMVPSTELSVDRPLWNGAFWAIYPPRDGAGVNEIRCGDSTLVLVWTPATAAGLEALAASADIQQLLADRGRQDMLPVVTINGKDPIHTASVQIAAAIASALDTDPHATELLDLLSPAPRRTAVVILCHELIWDLMDALETAGLVTRPTGFDDPQATTKTLIEQLLIRAKGSSSAP